MSNFRESVMLWLPEYVVEDDPEAIETVTTANGLIFGFMDGDIGLEQALDEMNDHHVDVDHFLGDLELSIRRHGG
jgi:hypothetical protein